MEQSPEWKHGESVLSCHPVPRKPVPPSQHRRHRAFVPWLKIAHQAGIGRSAVHLVATDGSGRMDPNALSDAVAADRVQGRLPVLIAATAGTTNAGMIDPLADCAEIARICGVWYHFDAAWGGALIAFDRLRGVLAGFGRADSLTIDAHKWFATMMGCWFATMMGCGMFITRHAQVSTSYMPSNIPNLDPYELRPFLSLAAAEWTGYGEHVERSIELFGLLRERLGARACSIANHAVLFVEAPPGYSEVRSIVDRVFASGRASISASTVRGPGGPPGMRDELRDNA